MFQFDDLVFLKAAEWLTKAGAPYVSVIFGAGAAVCLTKAAVAWKGEPRDPDAAQLWLLFAIVALIPAVFSTFMYGLKP